MKMLRLVYSMAIYLIVALVYALAITWVYDGQVLNSFDKIGILFAGLFILPPVILLLEIGEIRDNIIDALLDEGDDE